MITTLPEFMESINTQPSTHTIGVEPAHNKSSFSSIESSISLNRGRESNSQDSPSNADYCEGLA